MKFLKLEIYILVCYCFTSSLAQTSSLFNTSTELESTLTDEFYKLMSTGHPSPELENYINYLQFPNLFRSDYQRTSRAPLECIGCRALFGGILGARRSGVNRAILKLGASQACILLKVETPKNCRLVVESQIDILLYIIDNKASLTAARFCGIFLQTSGCIDGSRVDWTIELPPPLEVTKKPKISSRAGEPLKVLQITDLHYDPDYTVGSEAACSGNMCCQPDSTASRPEEAAGRWGDYRGCDTPWDLFNDTIHQIAERHELDYIMFTGDIIDHKVWLTGSDKNSEIITKICNDFKSVFGDTTILPIIGNHEPHPVNVFTSENVEDPNMSTKWLFETLADIWITSTSWLREETRNTILRGGYYTFLFKPGFRIVALNSNVCYGFNWWLLYDDYDPYGQLRWLVDVLTQAEINSEIVHILSHIPSSESDCFNNWSHEYTKIINRFAKIIHGQFNGHTHQVSHLIYYDLNNTNDAISVAFNGGSLTTYKHVNPDYAIYYVDPDSYEILDVDVWTFNLTDANLTPELSPSWYKLFSFKEAYGVEDLSPKSLSDLAVRLARSRELSDLYFKHMNRAADTSLARGCNNDCHLKNLCDMVSSYHGDDRQCEYLKGIRNSATKQTFIGASITLMIFSAIAISSNFIN